MGFLSYLIIGLIAGAIAKLVIPGKQGGGWFSTLLLGVIGAVVVGWIFSWILGENIYSGGFFSGWTWLYAIAGAILAVVVWQLIRRRSGKKA